MPVSAHSINTAKSMKIPLLLFVLHCLSLPVCAKETAGVGVSQLDLERDRQIGYLARECSDSIQQAGSLPAEQAIEIYGNVLKRLGGWDRPDTLEVFYDAQQKLLSIPGHAIHYRDKINAAKNKVRSGEMPVNDWGRLLTAAFHTLQYMPSEETVEVLAEFGGDKFGRPWSKEPQDFKDVPALHGLDNDLSTAGMGAIDIHAYHALDALGIEPPPYQDRAQVNELDFDRIWGGWWQEVKTGKRKYRFKGSDVLHPVNAPPGAGRDERRPERRPGEQINSEKKFTPKQGAPGNELKSESESPRWQWLIGLGVALLGIVAIILKQRGR
jgi:hypothetical protein